MAEHIWYTPADIASQLDARQHGSSWRAKCPAHGGDNPQALLIKEGTDKHGHPCTILKCFAHDCDIRDICAALGIELRQLFCIHPDYAKVTKYAPRAKGPGIGRLYTLANPSQDDMAETMLVEMIVSDPDFIRECTPARATLYRLAQASPRAKSAFFYALAAAGISPNIFWTTLQTEQGTLHDR